MRSSDPWSFKDEPEPTGVIYTKDAGDIAKKQPATCAVKLSLPLQRRILPVSVDLSAGLQKNYCLGPGYTPLSFGVIPDKATDPGFLFSFSFTLGDRVLWIFPRE